MVVRGTAGVGLVVVAVLLVCCDPDEGVLVVVLVCLSLICKVLSNLSCKLL